MCHFNDIPLCSVASLGPSSRRTPTLAQDGSSDPSSFGAPFFALTMSSTRKGGLTCTASSPDGRKFMVEARPIGVPPFFGGLGVILRPLGWLLHFVSRGGWKVEVTQSASFRQWKVPTIWETSVIPDRDSAVNELDRLVQLIEAGTWPDSTKA